MNYDSSGVKRIEEKVKDKKFLITIINRLTVLKGKQLLQNEIEAFIHYVDGLNFSLLKNDLPSIIVEKIAQNFSRMLSRGSSVLINNHEIMKRQIGSIPHDGAESLYTDVECAPFSVDRSRALNAKKMEGFRPGRALNTEEDDSLYNMPYQHRGRVTPITDKKGLQNIYLCLDSMERNLSTTSSIFKWTVMQSSNTQQGTVCTLADKIHNVVNVQFNRFRIPYVGSADNVYQRISVYIEEFSNQSVLIRSRRRYHMMFDAEVKGNQIELTPEINDEGRFRFHTPLNILDSITMQFLDPFVPVVFEKDRYDVTITSVSSTTSKIVFSEDHGVSDGERVHITEYDTSSSTSDSTTIDTVNREKGHIVTSVNNTTLTIEVDLSGVTEDTTNTATCFIATRRIILPIRMEYLV